ncbi:MAG: FkbM family methyltransferase [Pseudomonadota bacterium]
MRTVKLHGEPFTVGGGYDVFWDQADDDRWEVSTFEAIKACVDADTVVLDIGAWIGPTVLYAASRARRVIAFEPDPVAATALRENLAMNAGITAKVAVEEAAVWREGGTLSLGSRGALGDSMSSALVHDGAATFEARAIAAGELMNRLGADEKLFIKMDVEGAEYAIIPALRPLLDRPNVSALVAFHPRIVAGRKRLRVFKTWPLTRTVMAAFRGFDVRAARGDTIGLTPALRLYRATGLVAFEAKRNLLFTKGAR